MATKENIITLPHKNLRKKSTRVGLISEDIRKIILDMQEATIDWENSRKHEVGVALAAVQINVMMRVVIVRENIDDKENHRFKVFINPEITKYEGELVEDFEGCLSIKDMYGRVPRYNKVKVKALGLDGKEFRVTVNGFLARVMQHEIDHTKGTVFIDHIKHNPDAFFKLGDDGKLTELDYEKDVKNNKTLW